jgi:hypothetical protein
MPLKLNIAMSRKVGEPNYGSRGATVGLEMEVDSNLVDHPRQLHERIARLFRLAKQSVDRELKGTSAMCEPHANENGSAASEQPLVRPATPAQVRAIHAIANRQQLHLPEELRNRFGVFRADELTLDQASHMIDAIKPSANGAAQP